MGDVQQCDADKLVGKTITSAILSGTTLTLGFSDGSSAELIGWQGEEHLSFDYESPSPERFIVPGVVWASREDG